jgi:hypothetical protein
MKPKSPQSRSREKLFAPNGWYEQDEFVVKNWVELQKAFLEITSKNPDRLWVWRGQPDSRFSLTSHLYRHMASDPRFKGGFPSELDLIESEHNLIQKALDVYRITPQNALMILAQLQHLKVPTRFIDVTKNAYIAAWFASVSSPETKDSDCRIFAFGYAEESSLGNRTYAVSQLGDPFWFSMDESQWGVGKLSVWFPPLETHPRVFAQDAGFVFDGVPQLSSGKITNYRKRSQHGKATEYWSKQEIQEATSIDVNFVNFKMKARIDSKKTPVYTIRIKSGARAAILRQLSLEMGLSTARLFPGLEGLAAAEFQ